MGIFRFILDLIAPKKCYSCNKEGHFLCEKCQEKELHYKESCYVCKKNSKNFVICQYCKKNVFYDKIIVLNNYNSKITSKLIKDAKFYNKKAILEDFVPYLYDKFLLNQKIVKKEDFIIISVPSYWRKKMKRGYNQSEVLCKVFGELSGIKYRNLIKKTKNTKQQSLLKREERLKNLENVFSLRNKSKNLLKNKHVIVIDDVISTGSTINEISKILKKAKVKEIIGITIASG